MFLSLAAYLLIEGVAWLVLRIRHPRDARTPKDERERLIDLKAMRIAYYVYATGGVGGIFVTLHVAGGTLGTAVTVVFLAFVVSQIARHAARIVYFRRGA